MMLYFLAIKQCGAGGLTTLLLRDDSEEESDKDGDSDSNG
jgi:hypothetical protein